MLPRAVLNPVISEALRIALSEPSGENRRIDPLGDVSDDVGDVSRETILIDEDEDEEAENAGIIKVAELDGSGWLYDWRGGLQAGSTELSLRAATKAIVILRIAGASKE